MPTFRDNLHLGTKDTLVDTDSIADLSITEEKLADGAVTTDKIADDAVTNDKLACDSVGSCQIQDGAVTLEKTTGLTTYITEKLDEVEQKITGQVSASTYAFLDLGEADNIVTAQQILNTVYATTESKYQGRLKLLVNGQLMWIDQFAINYPDGYWMQVVTGPFKPSSDGTMLIVDESVYGISYRWRNSENDNWTWQARTSDNRPLKTINGQSLEGEGDIVIGEGGTTVTVDLSLDTTSENPVRNSAIATKFNTVDSYIAALQGMDGQIFGLQAPSGDASDTETTYYDVPTGVIIPTFKLVKYGNQVLAEAGGLYYTGWAAQQGYPSSDDLDGKMFYYVEDGVLYLYHHDGTELVLEWNSTPEDEGDVVFFSFVQSSQPSTSGLSEGTYWLNPDTTTLRRLTSGAWVTTSLENDILYVDAVNNIVYIYKNSALVPITSESSNNTSTEPDFTHFDYVKGNPGIFTINKNPEDINTEDVVDAYTVVVPNGYDGTVLQSETEKRAYLVNINGTNVLSGPNSQSEVSAWEGYFGSRATTPHLWTAYEIGLASGTSSTVASSNKDALVAAIANTSCIGFNLDAVYRVVPSYEHVAAGGVYSPDTHKEDCINLGKDFIISGAACANGKGGFTCHYNLFYTEYSLCVHNASFVKDVCEYSMIFVNLENGVDQIQVIDSEFTTLDSSASKGRYLLVYSPNTRPYKLLPGETSEEVVRIEQNVSYANRNIPEPPEGTIYSCISNGGTPLTYTRYTLVRKYHQNYLGLKKVVREVANYNYLNHLYVSGNSFEGKACLEFSGGTRFVKSARIVQNKFYNITQQPIAIGCPNLTKGKTWIMNAVTYGKHVYGTDAEKEWLNCFDSRKETLSHLYMATTRIYMSCPVYMVGNDFSGMHIETVVDSDYNECIGAPRIYKDKSGYGPYMCSALTETSTVYFLHNKVSDLVSGVYHTHVLNTDTNLNEEKFYGVETYDLYGSCAQLYYCNNVIENIVKFVKANNDDRNTGVCKGKNTNVGLIRGGLPYKDLLRDYKNNRFLLDAEYVKKGWMYYQSQLDAQLDADELAYDSVLTAAEVDSNGSIPADGRVFTISFAASVLEGKDGFDKSIYPTYDNHPVLKEFAFCGNVVDAGEGGVAGFASNSAYPTNKILYNNNTFIGKRFSNTNWDDRNIWKKLYNPAGSSAPPSYLLSMTILSIPKYGKSVVEVQNNTIIDNGSSSLDSGASIRLLCNRYYATNPTNASCTSQPEGDISIIRDNKYVGNKEMSIVIDKSLVSSSTGSGSSPTNLKKETFTPDAYGTMTDLLEYVYGVSGKTTTIGESPNPNIGDTYVDVVDDEIKLYTCTDEGKPAKVSVWLEKDDFDSHDVILNKLQLPLLSDEIIGSENMEDAIKNAALYWFTDMAPDRAEFASRLILNTEQDYIGQFNSIATSMSDATDDELKAAQKEFLVGYLANNVTTIRVTTLGQLRAVLRIILYAYGYAYNTSGKAGTFQIAGGSYDTVLYIYPKHVGAAVSYFKSHIGSVVSEVGVPQLQDMVLLEDNNNDLSFVPVDTTYNYYPSIEGTAAEWEYTKSFGSKDNLVSIVATQQTVIETLTSRLDALATRVHNLDNLDES